MKKEKKEKEKKKKKKLKQERCIYERQTKNGDVYYQVKIAFRDPNTGKNISRSFGNFYVKDYGTPTECMKEARRRRSEAEEEIARGRVPVKTKTVTVNDCYTASLRLQSLSMDTVKSHNITYGQLVPKDLQQKDITRVTAEDVQLSLNSFADGATKGKINDAMTIWHQIYQAAIMKDLDVRDRSMQVQKPEAKVPTVCMPTKCTLDDLRATLNALESYGGKSKKSRHRCKLIQFALKIMYYEGLRPQEVLALSREDIDLQGMVLHVRKSVGSTTTETCQIIPTKTDQSVRSIAIADALAPILKDLLDWSKSDPLLADFDGKPCAIEKIDDLLRNLREKYKTPYVVLRMMRHLAATELYNSTTYKKDVKEIFGHNSTGMTEYYVNPDEDKQRELINSRTLL